MTRRADSSRWGCAIGACCVVVLAGCSGDEGDASGANQGGASALVGGSSAGGAVGSGGSTLSGGGASPGANGGLGGGPSQETGGSAGAPTGTNAGAANDSSGVGASGAGAGGASSGGASPGGSGGLPGSSGTAGTTGTGAGAVSGSSAAQNPCPTNASFGDPLINAPTPVLIAADVGFLEGPVWIAHETGAGALYYSNFTGTGSDGRIRTYQPDTMKLSVFLEGVGTNGLAVDEKGMLVAGFHQEQRLLRFDPLTGEKSAVLGGDGYLGKPFNSVNDLVVRSDGHIYFTDPTYQQGDRTGQDAQAYYHLTPEGVVTRIGTQAQPNGIALSPDGRWLYANSSGTPSSLLRHAVAKDGSVDANSTKLGDASGDGMAVDCAGNLYLTTGGGRNGTIRILSPEGAAMGVVSGFTGGTTNAAFGGPKRTTLFVTTSNALFQLELAVPGLPN